MTSNARNGLKFGKTRKEKERRIVHENVKKKNENRQFDRRGTSDC